MAISANQSSKKRRAALRAAGFRLIQIWVPDTRRSDFQEICRRQSASLTNDSYESDVTNWIVNIEDQNGWKT